MLTGILRPVTRSGAILCYHGVATGTLRSPIHHTIGELKAAVCVARELGEIIPLAEFVQRHLEGKSTARLFAITFDDAYLSLQVASGFFRREQVPVTVFAISDALDEGRRFWWDRLGAVVARLTVDEITALSDQWGIPKPFRARWLGTAEGSAGPLKQWVMALHAARWPDHLEESLCALEQAHGTPAIDRSMTWSELAAFVATGPVDIGVHTSSHPVLSLLNAAEQRHEIATCHERLRERLTATIPVVAAPFGLFNSDTIAATQHVGLSACLGLGNRTIRFGGNTGALPRFCMIHPDSSLKLGPRLSGFIDHIRAWQGEGAPGYPIPPTVADVPSPT